MNILLWFFAIPVAIIILSIIFETILNCPIKIAGIVFSIFLIVTFAIGDETLLIFTIIYTILAYVVSWITRQWTNGQNSGCCPTNNAESCLEQLIQNANSETVQSLQNANNSSCGCGRRRMF